jgi:hypothetical protein
MYNVIQADELLWDAEANMPYFNNYGYWEHEFETYDEAYRFITDQPGHSEFPIIILQASDPDEPDYPARIFEFNGYGFADKEDLDFDIKDFPPYEGLPGAFPLQLDYDEDDNPYV